MYWRQLQKDCHSPEGFFRPGKIKSLISVPSLLTVILLSGLFLIQACKQREEIPDVSEVAGTYQLVHFEDLLFNVPEADTLNYLSRLRESYPQFWDIYFQFILPIQDPGEDTVDFEEVASMIVNERMRWLEDTVEVIAPFNTGVQEDLERAFQFYRYYFPERQTPNVYTLISDFSYFPFIFPDTNYRDAVGISLEMFLGSEFPYKQYSGNIPVFSNYLLRTYNPDHIVKKTMDVIIDDLLGPLQGDRLIDHMIRNGRQMYLLNKFLPFAHDSILTEYSPAQLQWCRDNERNLWAHFLTEDLLYSSETRKFQKFVQHSPGVPGLPEEAPGRTANWVGYRIVEAFMNRNSSATLKELVEMDDAQELLDRSKYKPL